MYIKSLSLTNWRNFKKVNAVLGYRTFIIGPNASGKSNFLDAFRFLHDLVESGLSKAIASRGGISSIRCLAATRVSYVEIDVILANDKPTNTWRYVLQISQDHVSRPIIKKEEVYKGAECILRRPDSDDSSDTLRLTQTALEQIVANKDFRVIADSFKDITYQHIIPQVVRDPKGFTQNPVTNDPFGRDFLSRLWNTNQRTRGARLKKIARALQIAIPQLAELELEQDSQGAPHLVGRYSHWRPNAAKQYEQQFSDGTLRLLALMWFLFEGSGPLLLEEPELSLHDEVVRHLPQLFEQIQKERQSRRQLIISTHSRELLSDKGISADEVLWLEPTEQGTDIKQASDTDIEAMKHGLTIADILLPKTAPKNIEQLSLIFSD